jgi:glucose-6-phosphate isomerase
MKLDISGLKNERVLMEAPETHKDSKAELLKRFEETVLNEKSQTSSYRNLSKLKLDQEKSLQLAEKFRSRFKRLFLLGTGGSSLGAKALYTALKNHCDRELICIENLDVSDLPQKFTTADFKESAVVAISKSGNTLETLLALAYFEDQYKKNSLSLSDHFAIITDAGSNSAITQWSSQNKVEQLFMDPLLGGRWSVTSSVGAFPLAFAGVNFRQFFSGIESVYQKGPNNEAVEFALRLCDLDQAQYQLHSLWTYSSKLREIGAWWRQLWSESLGKVSHGITKGSFALPCVGSIDQHSVLQQLYEGHSGSYTGFIFVQENEADLTIQNLSPAIAQKFAFCQGKTWTEINRTQGLATLQSLSEQGRPSYTLTLESIDEKSLGSLFAFWMDIVALTGCGLKINPFDQPGVERAKKIFNTLF